VSKLVFNACTAAERHRKVARGESEAITPGRRNATIVPRLAALENAGDHPVPLTRHNFLEFQKPGVLASLSPLATF